MTTTRDMEIITLAKKVMRWNILSEAKHHRLSRDRLNPETDVVDCSGQSGWDIARRDEHKNAVLKWDPYISIADAWILVDALRKRDLWFKLVTPWTSEDHEYSAGFTEFGTVDCGSSWVKGRGPTACEAICAAAQAATKGGKR